MRFYWYMPEGLKPHFRQELSAYKAEFAKGNLSAAWRHLERAHILGQPWPREHNQVHWLMLKFGIHIKNSREIRGQLTRLLLGGVFSFFGKAPVGNTGGANVPPLQPMEIPDDLARLLNKYKSS